MDTSGRPGAPISFSDAFHRRWGLGAEMMRRTRIDIRRGFIACTRLVMAQDLELQTGRREPHW